MPHITVDGSRLARIDIFARRDWQMSPGDRAALEGVLCALSPGLSIEVGTARGGSLARMAAHSETVHTFDLERPPELPPNAAFHRGDSRGTLPAALAELDRNVDFALVDGEHTEAAVAADLGSLLDSPRVQRAVILAHDSFHPPCAPGSRRLPATRR